MEFDSFVADYASLLRKQCEEVLSAERQLDARTDLEQGCVHLIRCPLAPGKQWRPESAVPLIQVGPGDPGVERIDRALLTELATCRYLDTATNVLLIGPPGIGKTHIATGLGHAAVTGGYRVYFTSAADLAARCHRAAIEGKWSTMMRFFVGPTLLIIDELGYLPLPAEAASALFQVINQRYLKTSIVITTNRPVGAWGEILGDTTVAAAMLDRLLHRSVVVTLDGASYRLRNRHAAADEIRRATTGTNLR